MTAIDWALQELTWNTSSPSTASTEGSPGLLRAPTEARSSAVVRRRRAPRTRSGCKTCRLRRVRCDEAKPICRNCTIANKQCDYDSVRRFVEVQPQLPQLQGTTPEKRAFSYFQVRTAQDFTGLFVPGFWQRTVLQMSLDYDCIKHAVTAISSFHECFDHGLSLRSPAVVDSRQIFALQQYGNAIKELNTLIATESCPPEVAMVCCALFICFESARGAPGAVMVHFKNGLRLVQSWKEGQFGKRTSSEAELTQEVQKQFLRIGQAVQAVHSVTQTNMTQAEIIADHAELHASLAQMSELHDPPTFHSVQDVRDHLAKVHAWQLCYLYQINPLYGGKSSQHHVHLVTLREFLVRQMGYCDMAMDIFYETYRSTLSANDLRAIHYLQIKQEFVAAICLSMFSRDPKAQNVMDESVYNVCTPGYRKVIAGLESYMGLTSSPSSSASTSSSRRPEVPTFTPENGIVCILFTLGRSCQDPFLRRRALELLKSVRVIEGLWDSEISASMLGTWVEIKEAEELESTMQDLSLGGAEACRTEVHRDHRNIGMIKGMRSVFGTQRA